MASYLLSFTLRNCRGTIKDDTITSAAANNSAAANSATAANNVQHTNDQPWYDKLASDDNDKAKKSEDGKPKTNEREEISEGVQQQVNDSVKPQYVYYKDAILCIICNLSFSQIVLIDSLI